MDNWEKQLLELSEKIGKTMISVNKALTEFMRTDTFKNLVDFLAIYLMTSKIQNYSII